MYRCILSRNGLTAGKIYKEKAAYPCPRNAKVVNDEGEIVSVNRREYFKVVKDESFNG